MSVKRRLTNIEKQLGVNKKVIPLPKITKRELLYYDYPEYREALVILQMCFWFYEGDQEAKEWAGKIKHMEETLKPKTRPADYDRKKAEQLNQNIIGQVWDKYPEIERQCFKYYDTLRKEEDWQEWYKALNIDLGGEN